MKTKHLSVRLEDIDETIMALIEKKTGYNPSEAVRVLIRHYGPALAEVNTKPTTRKHFIVQEVRKR